ncbi:MAG: DHA2 family efflux MFS transporter permease subunit [Drouetiella hepatica Uher 2000/2452]|jgi:EmrB/QacA subfamily drug resistance transporter|uniref:DHA2 family efflux MFS transporter permease subunit n=1 Tax=Drouetiella hepatica Uher 2000/2452 TaxID=904376 RepID=A0A951QEA2_9CYAN|nr:DHA2 family efflux MFS transporter permease subunit [Drouetiella hepatica Uher 2000/2452]
MLGVGLGVLMFTLDTSIVNIALPTLVQVLQTDFATIQWVVLSYLLVLTAVVLGAARLGDIMGKKRLYMGGLALFTLSSLLCGLSPSVGWLIAFRTLQGMGAVMISALGAAIVTEVFPSSERGRALGIIGATVSLGIALGPSVGGVLIGLSGWRSIFLVNVPIGIFALFVVARNVTDSRSAAQKQPFDWLGAILMTATLICFSLGMTNGQYQGFGSFRTVILLAIAAAGFIGFIAVEARLKHPMLDLKLFRNLYFSLSLLTGVLVFVVIAGLLLIVPFFLELVLNLSTQQAGLLMAVSPILSGIVAPFAGLLSDRFGSRLITLAGLLIMTIACLLMSTLYVGMTELEYVLRVAPIGIGLGMFQSPNNSAILGEVPPERLGIASGLLSLSRTLGQTIGLPVMGAIFSVLTLSHALGVQSAATDITNAPPEAIVAGVQGAFHVATVIMLAAATLVAGLWQMERRRQQSV